MATFIKLGDHIINLDQVVDVFFYVEAGVPNAVLRYAATDYVDDSGRPDIAIMGVEGEEAEALGVYFERRADDVLEAYRRGRTYGEAPGGAA